MERKALQRLLKWKDQSDRKPLILLEARQVGKIWLMKYSFLKVFYIPQNQVNNATDWNKSILL